MTCSKINDLVMRGWSEMTESSIWSRNTVHLAAWRWGLEHCLLGTRWGRSSPVLSLDASSLITTYSKAERILSGALGFQVTAQTFQTYSIMVAHRLLVLTQAIGPLLYSFLLTYLLSNLLNIWCFCISVFPKFLTYKP